MLFCYTWTGGQKHGYSQQCTKNQKSKEKKEKQKIGSQLLSLSKEEAQPEIRSQVCLSRFSNESSNLIGKSYPGSWGLIFESVRAYNSICKNDHDYSTRWV